NNKEIIDVFTLKFVTLFDIISRIGGMCFRRGKDKEKRKREIGWFLPGFGLWVLLLPSPAVRGRFVWWFPAGDGEEIGKTKGWWFLIVVEKEEKRKREGQSGGFPVEGGGILGGCRRRYLVGEDEEEEAGVSFWWLFSGDREETEGRSSGCCSSGVVARPA
ncbi:hypothetical protein HAX54_039089, partial [Datura stramonium]|nr:hypothetical protein [Datura stramonium]